MSVRSGEDYNTSAFDVKAYLNVWSGEALKNYPIPDDIVRDLHQVFNTVKTGGLRQLDFGCGATIVSVLSSSRSCSQITQCEYAEQCREEVTKWLHRHPEAHDWKPYMDLVAELEGSDMTWADVERRVRSSITGVIPCDILKDDLFPGSSIPTTSFDVITSSFCLEAACLDKISYFDAQKKLACFLKKGGLLALCGVLKGNWYNIGAEKFHNLYLRKEDVDDALTQAGYEPATWYIHEEDSTDSSVYSHDSSAWFTLSAIKK